MSQSIKENVKKHVEENLEKAVDDTNEEESKKKKKKKAKKKKKKKKKKQKTSSNMDNQLVDDTEEMGEEDDAADGEDEDGEVEPEKKKKKKKPYRILHEALQIDLLAGAGYRGWAPQQYPGINVSMANYFTWSAGGSVRLFKWVNFRKVKYESSGASSPRTSYVSDAAKYGSPALKAAWFLAELGVPVFKAWEPTFHYETRSFRTRAETKGNSEVCVIPFGQDTDVEGCTPQSGSISVVSSFESAVLGMRYFPKKDARATVQHSGGKAPTFLFGAAYMSYVKPYQVTIGEAVLEEYLFTGRFYGGGLALGMTLGGGVNYPYLDIWAQFGLGRVRLTEDLTLNELAPDDWLIGYVQGNVTLSYKWAPFEFAPTLMFVPSGTVSGATFFFFKTQREEGEKFATPAINWDVLYTVRLSLVMTF